MLGTILSTFKKKYLVSAVLQCYEIFIIVIIPISQMNVCLFEEQSISKHVKTNK